jgi:uncharacterized membrane protein HdeD (DUF308 family)
MTPRTGKYLSVSLPHRRGGSAKEAFKMIVLGIVLLIIGFIAHIPILWTLGVVVLVIGAVLFLLGSAGHALGGRRHYW